MLLGVGENLPKGVRNSNLRESQVRKQGKIGLNWS